MPKTVLVLSPHPDDAEISAGGTIASLAAGGAQVVIVTVADGRCGSFDLDSEALVAVRAEEARRAAEILGAEPPLMLGYRDTELDRLAPGVLREELVRLIRHHKPDLAIAPDPFAPQEIHPDHRVVALAAAEALSFAPLPLVCPGHLAEGLGAHFVAEKYFYTEGFAGANHFVDISLTMVTKLAAVAEHKSQISFLVEDILRQARVAGLDLGSILGAAAGDPQAAMRWALERRASEAGARVGVKFAEAFRRTRFHPFVESLLAGARPSMDRG